MLFGFSFSGLVYAQGMVILGDNSAAKNCHRAAESAATMRFVSQEDVAQCDRALNHGSLKQRDRVATYVNRGILYAAQEDYQAAARDYQRAESIGGPSGEVYANRGNLKFIQREYQTAIEYYDQSIALGMPRVHVAYVNRGLVKEAVGDLRSAKSDYQKALELSPEWRKALQFLVRVELKISKQNASE